MSFFRPKGAPSRNYDLYKGYSYYTPGVKGMFALLGMLLFHHKTRHAKFVILVPLFLAAHAALFWWLMTKVF